MTREPIVAVIVAGSTVFMKNIIGDVLIESGTGKAGTAGLAIVLGVMLDGLPESFVLGASLVGGGGVSVSFLVAVMLSNLPEGLAGARDQREEGRSPKWILALWTGVALASGVVAALGFALVGSMPGEPQAFAQAFAAGAILTMLADTLFPEAYEGGGKGVGLATLLGFTLAFFLSTIPG